MPSDQIPPANRILPLVPNTIHNLVPGRDDDGIISGLVLEVRENDDGLVHAAVRDQPPGPLGQPGHGGEQDEQEQELQRQGEPPRDGAAGKKQAKVDPVDQGEADDVHGHLEHDQPAAPPRLRRLRLPHGRRGRVDAVADAVGREMSLKAVTWSDGEDQRRTRI